jgi:hypothetical protein
MSTELSTSTRALFRAARIDAPSDAARAKILEGIGATTGGAATISIAAKAATGGTKLLLTGALFGSALTVGVAAFVLGVAAPKSRLAPEPSFAMHADPEMAPVAPAAPAMRASPAEQADAVRPSAPVKAHAASHAHASATGADYLAREATLVSEARGALMRGQADTALGALRATELLPSRAMEPEELSLEARALRALGRGPEADFVEGQLRARFPDNALSR